jgi:hypothetical protein
VPAADGHAGRIALWYDGPTEWAAR